MTMETVVTTPSLRWRPADGALETTRRLAEETAVALVHDGSTTAVMMATPADLEDLGIGFSLSEGIIESTKDISDLQVAVNEIGVEVRLWLIPDRTKQLAARRRHLAGPTGCGLCGIESLAEAARPIARISEDDFIVPADALLTAMKTMELAQRIGEATRAVHAAGLWRPDTPMVVREDVGRHNALDKLIGATATSRRAPGVLLLTSRVSVEMIQKAVVLGVSVLCAVSAPTALAVRTAEAAGLTVVGITRADGFEVFTHPRRVDVSGRR